MNCATRFLWDHPIKMRDLIGQYQDAGADQLNISIRATRDRRQGSGAYDLDGISELAAILPMTEVNTEHSYINTLGEV